MENFIVKQPDLSKCQTCQHCQGQADLVYFEAQTGEILAVICRPCKDLFEQTVIKSIAKSFATNDRVVH